MTDPTPTAPTPDPQCPQAPDPSPAGRVAWIVFRPDGTPFLPAARETYEEAMQACFGNRLTGRGKDHWQSCLDSGWTIRAISLDAALATGAGAAVPNQLARIEAVAAALAHVDARRAVEGDETALSALPDAADLWRSMGPKDRSPYLKSALEAVRALDGLASGARAAMAEDCRPIPLKVIEGILDQARVLWNGRIGLSEVDGGALEALIEARDAAPPQAVAVAGEDVLWSVHVRGPDHVVAVASYEDAVRFSDGLNLLWQSLTLTEDDPWMSAVPMLWEGTPEGHVAALAKLGIKGHDYGLLTDAQIEVLRDKVMASRIAAPDRSGSAGRTAYPRSARRCPDSSIADHLTYLEAAARECPDDPVRTAMLDAVLSIRADLDVAGSAGREEAGEEESGAGALSALSDAVDFLDRVKAASEAEKTAVGAGHWTRLETAARAVVAGHARLADETGRA